MSNEFVLDRKGVIDLFKSAGMQTALKQASDSVANIAGDGYVSAVDLGKYTAIGVVYTWSFKAQLDNARNNTLLKACGSAGLNMEG